MAGSPRFHKSRSVTVMSKSRVSVWPAVAGLLQRICSARQITSQQGFLAMSPHGVGEVCDSFQRSLLFCAASERVIKA
jgi:hypothetical protein